MSDQPDNLTESKPKTHYTPRRTLGLYWVAVKRYRWLAVFHLTSVAGAVVLQSILVPWLLSRGVSALPGFLAQPEVDFWPVFGGIIMAYVAAQAGQWILHRASGFALIHLEARITRNLEQSTFAHLTTLSYRFFATSFSGALVAQSNRFVSAFEQLYESLAFEIMPLVLRLSLSFTLIFMFAPTIAWGILAFTVLFMTSTLVLFTKKMPASKRSAAAHTKLTAQLADNLANISAMKYFAREREETKRYNATSQYRFRMEFRAWTLQELILAWQALLMTIFEILVFITALRLVAARQIDLGQLVLIQVFIFGIFSSLWSVGRIARNIERSLANAAEMTDILCAVPEVQDDPAAAPIEIKKGAVAFRHMTFAYDDDGKRQPVFENLDLVIKPGEKVGLVGPSGGGKTTITKLLLRLMDIESGQILLDGHDIAKMRQTDLREAISYVPQEPALFHRSLRENIAYGHPNATDEQVAEAARRAHAAEFIERLPDGYSTLVGERGIKLSGGQRQRVAIARAMLKAAPVLVLDEATSALDSESERLIQDALWRLMEGRTAIVIAHRLSTIQRMDRIVVLDGGTIAEQGSHTGLLAHGGVYARLWSHQSGGFIDDEEAQPAEPPAAVRD